MIVIDQMLYVSELSSLSPKYAKISLEQSEKKAPQDSHVILTKEQARRFGLNDLFAAQTGLLLTIEELAESSQEPNLPILHLAKAERVESFVPIVPIMANPVPLGYMQSHQIFANFSSLRFVRICGNNGYTITPRYYLSLSIDEPTFDLLQRIDRYTRFTLNIDRYDHEGRLEKEEQSARNPA